MLPRRGGDSGYRTESIGAGGDYMALRASDSGIARRRDAGLSKADRPATTRVRLRE